MTPKELKRLKKLQAASMKLPECEVLEPRWDGICIVAATGESLTKQVAAACIESGHPIIAVKQAWKRFPQAQVLYNLDAYWWRMFRGVPEFQGEKWTAHDQTYSLKLDVVQEFELRVVRGAMAMGFSTDPSVIHYGRNTGFQAINLAIHWLRGPKKRIALVGFDMTGGYFFGQHPRGINYGRHWSVFLPQFEHAAKNLPEGVAIVNCSPNSLLPIFPKADLATALKEAA